MKLREIINEKEKNISEALATVKFKYTNYNNDPRPRVKALDFTYPGQEGQKTYGKRDDVLGWNLNYFKNAEYAKKAIDDITDFARLLGSNKEEMYQRVKYLFPEQAQYIRRYIRKHIKGLQQRRDGLWKSATYPNLVRYNQTSF